MKGFFYLLFFVCLFPLYAEDVVLPGDPQSVLFAELELFTGETPRLDILRSALARGADPLLLNEDELSACHLAVIGGHPHILKLLLAYAPEGKAFKQGLEQFNRYMPFFALTHLAEQAVPLLEILLDQGYSPDLLDPESVPLITRSVYHSQEVLELLLSKGADTELSEPYHITPLMRAGSLDEGPLILKTLLAYDADIDAKDRDGWNALFYTVLFGGTEEAVQILLDQGLDINSRDSYGSSLLLWSAAYRHDENMIRFLVEKGASPSGPDKDGWIPLMAALQWENTPQIVEYLSRFLDDGRTRDGQGRPLSSYLEDYVRSQNISGDPPGSFSVSRRVYPADSMPVADLDLCLHETARWGDDPAMVPELVSAGASVDVAGENFWSPLMKAAAFNSPEMVRAFLIAGADPFYRTPDGWGVFHAAAWSDYPQTVRMLRAAGLDPEQSDRDGWTVFHWACRNNAPLKVLKYLIQSGADSEALTEKGETPLYLMASGWEAPDPRSLRLLLDNISNHDRADFQGVTPLMKASARGFTTAVRVLLDEGADTELKDHKGNRAEDFAAAQGHSDIVDLLRSR